MALEHTGFQEFHAEPVGEAPDHFALVAYAIGRDHHHDAARKPGEVVGNPARGATHDVTLTKPVPVHITYFTASADEGGRLKLHSDVYGMDGRVASALAGRTVHLASAPASPEATASTTRSSEPGTTSKRDSRKERRAKAQKKDDVFNPFGFLSN